MDSAIKPNVSFAKYLLISIVLLLALAPANPAFSKTFKTKDHIVKVEVLSDKLKNPWGMAFLPDGTILITEKGGTVRLYNRMGLSSPLKGVPKVVARGQGGLLDVAIDPDFKSNKHVYLSFSMPGDRGAGTAVARGTLDGVALKDTKVIYKQNKFTTTARHFGSRLLFANDGTLFVTHGDRGDRPRSQDPFDHAGSVIRINKDGSIPADNPFADGKKALPEIWSIGHRNIQGAALHPKTGEIWTVEHGARGGDEINKPEAGKNYGWPIISYGRHYSGFKIGEGTKKAGLEQPRYFWDPSIAPSGLTFYTGSEFESWKGDLFVGALGFATLVRLEMDGGKITGEERIFDGDYGRIRDVEQGPDGALYLLTNSAPGMLLKITAEK